MKKNHLYAVKQAAVLLSALAAIAVPASASELTGQPYDSVATVSGTGRVSVTPDIAAISFSCRTTDTTSEQAQKANGAKVNAVLDVLKENDVPEEDIQTSDYSIYPQYDYSDDNYGKISGYEASTTISISNLAIDHAAALMDKCVGAGADTINDINFTYSGYDAAYKEALKEAVSDAKEKAETLAEASGKEIVDIISVTEGYQDTSWRAETASEDYMAAKVLDDQVESSSAELLPGNAEIIAQVTATYQFK